MLLVRSIVRGRGRRELGARAREQLAAGEGDVVVEAQLAREKDAERAQDRGLVLWSDDEPPEGHQRGGRLDLDKDRHGCERDVERVRGVLGPERALKEGAWERLDQPHDANLLRLVPRQPRRFSAAASAAAFCPFWRGAAASRWRSARHF